MEESKMMKLWFASLWLIAIFLSHDLALAKTQTMVTGQDAEEVQENAFKQKMDYPVGPLKCLQRCSQWWERQ